MSNFSTLLISSAYAQATPPAVPTATGTATVPADAIAPAASGFASPQTLMIALIFAVFYFIVIRPQQKKLDEQNKMIKALQRGDRIVTTGGIHGKITQLDETTLTVEIADNVQIKIDRANVQALEAKPVPAPTSK